MCSSTLLLSAFKDLWRTTGISGGLQAECNLQQLEITCQIFPMSFAIQTHCYPQLCAPSRDFKLCLLLISVITSASVSPPQANSQTSLCRNQQSTYNLNIYPNQSDFTWRILETPNAVKNICQCSLAKQGAARQGEHSYAIDMQESAWNTANQRVIIIN